MKEIPTQRDNPHGLHLRYAVSKADGSASDPRAVYFVLRLDPSGSDPGHIAACRAAARAYCDNAPEWMRQTADELRQLVDGFDESEKRAFRD